MAPRKGISPSEGVYLQRKTTNTKNKTGNACLKVTMRRVRVTTVVTEKTISITYSECVFVALDIRHAMHMRRIVLSSVVGVTVPYFSTSSRTRGIKCVF